uniref:Uncharacterized protein n=1 Tax=Percolomonas cosmopolitus TaxID=63605 RepID=A0A7S1KQC3_9EUKA
MPKPKSRLSTQAQNSLSIRTKSKHLKASTKRSGSSASNGRLLAGNKASNKVPRENEPPMWMEQQSALDVDNVDGNEHAVNGIVAEEHVKPDNGQSAQNATGNTSALKKESALANAGAMQANWATSSLRRQKDVTHRPMSAGSTSVRHINLRGPMAAPPTVHANSLSLGVSSPSSGISHNGRRNTVDASGLSNALIHSNPLLQQSQRNRDVYERMTQRKRHSYSGHGHEKSPRKRKRVVHIPTTSTAFPQPGSHPSPQSHNQVGTDSSPDASLRQIFRSSSPSLMKELSRLLGPQEYCMDTQSPVRGNAQIPPVRNGDSDVGMYISRATLHRSPSSPSNKNAANNSGNTSPLSPFSEVTSENPRTPTPTREISSSPLSHVKNDSFQHRSSPKRALSPQAKFFNPESILNRTPVILQRRPKSTYLLERIVQERSSHDHYNRGSSPVHDSGIQGESLTQSSAAIAAELAKRRSSSVNLYGKLSVMTSSTDTENTPTQRPASSNNILHNEAEKKQVPSIRLSRMNSERQQPPSPSSMEQQPQKIQIIRPQTAIVSRRKPSLNVQVQSSSGLSRTKSASSKRRASSVNAHKRGHTARGQSALRRSSGNLPSGLRRRATQPNLSSEQIDDIAYIRFNQTEKPRNQFSVRELDSPSHVIYQSRGAGFISARQTTSNETPKWKSFERARSKKLRSRPQSASASRRQSAQQSINNLLHIQSISVTKGAKTSIDMNEK